MSYIPHDANNPAWWEQEARTERAFARERMQTVESIQIHIKNAEDYERRAAKLRCRNEWSNVNDPPCHPGDKDWKPCATCMTANAELSR